MDIVANMPNEMRRNFDLIRELDKAASEGRK